MHNQALYIGDSGYLYPPLKKMSFLCRIGIHPRTKVTHGFYDPAKKQDMFIMICSCGEHMKLKYVKKRKK